MGRLEGVGGKPRGCREGDKRKKLEGGRQRGKEVAREGERYLKRVRVLDGGSRRERGSWMEGGSDMGEGKKTL